MAIVVSGFGKMSGGLWITGDMTADGGIDLADLRMVQQNLSPGATSGASSPVPEPQTIVLFILACAWLLARFAFLRTSGGCRAAHSRLY